MPCFWEIQSRAFIFFEFDLASTITELDCTKSAWNLPWVLCHYSCCCRQVLPMFPESSVCLLFRMNQRASQKVKSISTRHPLQAGWARCLWYKHWDSEKRWKDERTVNGPDLGSYILGLGPPLPKAVLPRSSQSWGRRKTDVGMGYLWMKWTHAQDHWPLQLTLMMVLVLEVR